MQLWDTQARANSARATPQEDQELIRTLDLSLLARKNSFWSFAIRQRIFIFVLGVLILKNIKLFSPKKTDFNFLYEQNGNDNKETNTFTQNATDTAGRVSKY